jgi:hypothetical protein
MRWAAFLILSLSCCALGRERASIVVAGDSISNGAAQGRPTWPETLATISGAEVTNEAYSGFETEQMLAAFEAGPRRFDFCLFLGGVNDFRRGLGLAPTAETADRLLVQFRLARCRILILRPTPTNGAPEWDAEKEARIEAYWQHLKATWCDAGLATCLDTWRILGSRLDVSALSPEYNSGDGLHPSTSGQNTLGLVVFHLLFTK